MSKSSAAPVSLDDQRLISNGEAATFEALRSSYGRDKSHVYVNGALLPGADAASFELLDCPGFAKDRRTSINTIARSATTRANSNCSTATWRKTAKSSNWSAGSVLSNDPEHFAVISAADHYLFTKDGQTVHVNGNPIPDADPATNPKSCTALTHATIDASLLHRPNRRCGSAILPTTRRPVRKRLRPPPLNGEVHRRRGSENLTVC